MGVLVVRTASFADGRSGDNGAEAGDDGEDETHFDMCLGWLLAGLYLCCRDRVGEDLSSGTKGPGGWFLYPALHRF